MTSSAPKGIFDGMSTRKSRKAKLAEDNIDIQSSISQGTNDEDLNSIENTSQTGTLSGFSFISQTPHSVPVKTVVASRRRVQKSPMNTSAGEEERPPSQEKHSFPKEMEKTLEDVPVGTSGAAVAKSSFSFLAAAVNPPVAITPLMHETKVEESSQIISRPHTEEDANEEQEEETEDEKEVADSRNDECEEEEQEFQSTPHTTLPVGKSDPGCGKTLTGYQLIQQQRESLAAVHRDLLSYISKEARECNLQKCELFSTRNSTIQRRKFLQDEIHKAQRKQMLFVEKESYLEADALDKQIEEWKKEMQDDETQESMEERLHEIDEQLYELFGNITRRLDTYATQLQDVREFHHNALEAFVIDGNETSEKQLQKNMEEQEKIERQLKRAQADVEIQKQRDEKLTTKINELTKEIRSELHDLESTQESLNQEISALEEALRQKRESVRVVQNKMSTLHAQIDVVKADFAENLRLVQQQMQQDSDRVQACEDVLRTLQNEHMLILNQREEFESESQQRMNVLSEIEVEVKELTNKVANRHQSLQFFKNNAPDLKLREFREEHKTLTNRETAITKEHAHLTDLREQLLSVSSKIQQMTEHISECTKSLPDLEAAKKVAVANRAFKEAQLKVEQIKKVLDIKAHVENEIQSLQLEQKTLQMDISNIESALAQSKEKLLKDRERWARSYTRALQEVLEKINEQLKGEEMIDGSHSVLDAHAAWIVVTIEELEAQFADEEKLACQDQNTCSESNESESENSFSNEMKRDDHDRDITTDIQSTCLIAENTELTTCDIEQKIKSVEEELNSCLNLENYERCAVLEEYLCDLKRQLEKRKPFSISEEEELK